MENSATNMSKFSPLVELEKGAQDYIRFLQKVSEALPEPLDQNFISYAIERYEEYWLPLLASNDAKEDLIPPLDVYWVWYLHMTQPKHYAAHCGEKYRKPLPHSTKLMEALLNGNAKIKDRSRVVWEQKYPKMPYSFSRQDDKQINSRSRLMPLIQPLLDYHRTLSKATLLSQFGDAKFIKSAADRYKKFISLSHEQTKYTAHEIVVIPKDIELMWYVHLLHPLQYTTDMHTHIGNVLAFQPQLADSGNYDLISQKKWLSEFWHSRFQSDLFVPGSHVDSFYSITSSLADFPPDFMKDDGDSDVCDMYMDIFKVSSIWSRDKNLIIEVRRLGMSSVSYTTLFKTPAKADEEIRIQNGMGKVHFDSQQHRGIEIHIYAKRGGFCIKGEEHLATLLFNPREYFAGGVFYNKTWTVSVPRLSYLDPEVTFLCTTTVSSAKTKVFSCNRNPFDLDAFPESLSKQLNPYVEPVWMEIDRERGDGCYIATHDLIINKTQRQLKCDVVRCRTAMTPTAVVIRDIEGKNKYAMAFSVGEAGLPFPQQVSKDIPLTYNESNGDQAMAIVNRNGLWGICVAKCDDEADNDEVTVYFHHIRKKITTNVKVQLNAQTSFEIGHMVTNLQTGKISLCTDWGELVEHLILAFVVGSVTVLNQRLKIFLASSMFENLPDDLSGSVSTRSTTTSPAHAKARRARISGKNKKKQKRRRSSLCCTFFLACGLQADLSEEGAAISRSNSVSRSRAGSIEQLDAESVSQKLSKSGLPNGSHVDQGVSTVDVRL